MWKAAGGSSPTLPGLQSNLDTGSVTSNIKLLRNYMYQKILTLLRTVRWMFRFSTTLLLLVSRSGYWANRERSVSSKAEGRRQFDVPLGPELQY